MAQESASDENTRPIASFEFQAYVESLKASSDRTRWVLYTLIVSVAVLLLATWNIRGKGWPSAHLRAWHAYEEAARKNAEAAFARSSPVAAPVAPIPRAGDRGIQDDYVKEYVRRMLLVDLPLVGLAVDVNDVGTVGGTWLCVLLPLMTSAVAREHENLCLVLYKVISLFEKESRPSDRDGTANLLYHTLAMSQMLCHPPTLVRPNTRRTAIGFMHLLVFLPAILQGWIIYTSWPKLAAYQQIADVHMRTQIGLFVVMFLAGGYCVIHLQAMSDRWTKTFNRINPNQSSEPASHWSDYVRLEHTVPWLYRFTRSARPSEK